MNVHGKIHLLDVVALTEDVREQALVRGQVGTVVEVLDPDVFEVEFSDDSGHMYARAAIEAQRLIVLHYENAPAL